MRVPKNRDTDLASARQHDEQSSRACLWLWITDAICQLCVTALSLQCQQLRLVRARLNRAADGKVDIATVHVRVEDESASSRLQPENDSAHCV